MLCYATCDVTRVLKSPIACSEIFKPQAGNMNRISFLFSRLLLKTSNRILINNCATTPPTASSDKVKSVSLRASYSEPQRESILQTVNSADEKTLSSYGITLQLAKRIIQHRKANGQFKCIGEVLDVDGFVTAKLKRFYDNVANMTKTEKPTSRRLSIPEVSIETSEKISSVISMEFYPFQLSWVHVDRSSTILDWGNAQFSSQPKPFQHNITFHMARNLMSRLPQTDVFVIPKHTFVKPNPKMLNSMIGMRELEATVLTLIDKDVPEDSTRVFSAKPSVVSSFFSIKVGTERVSGQNVVKDLVSGRHCADIHKVKINEALWQQYMRLEPNDREPLANVLLQAVAFYELEVFKRPF